MFWEGTGLIQERAGASWKKRWGGERPKGEYGPEKEMAHLPQHVHQENLREEKG